MITYHHELLIASCLDDEPYNLCPSVHLVDEKVVTSCCHFNHRPFSSLFTDFIASRAASRSLGFQRYLPCW